LNGGGPTPDFSLSLNPNSLTLSPGTNPNVSVSITRTNGFANAVSFSLAGAPAGVSGTFTPNGTTGNTSTLNLTVSASTAPGTYALTVAGSGGSLNRSATLSLLVQSSGGGGSKPSLGNAIIAACYAIIVGGQVNCDDQKSAAIQLGGLAGKSAVYKLTGLAAGDYFILGWKDVNGNKEIDNGDYLGAYVVNGDLALVRPGNLGANFELDVIQSTSAVAEKTRVLLPQVLPLLR
jgi:serine protease